MHEQIKNQIKEALRGHDTLRLEVLRSLTSAFTNHLIAKKSAAPTVSDADATEIIRKAVKQRKDSIEQFTAGGRKDLVKKEKAELDILEAFLPQLMSKKDIKVIIAAKIKKEGKPDKAKAGQFMGAIMKDLKGKADGMDVKAVIDEILG
ncbi:MAG: GatB/YqeY domain-containing protein [bacterium]